MVNPAGSVDRSLRRRGQLLVVVGALLGAMVGIVLGLAVEDTGSSSAVAAPERGVALAASPQASQPPASRATNSGSQGAGNDASRSQPVESADRPDKGHAEARKDGDGRKDKPGKDKPSKDKEKDK